MKGATPKQREVLQRIQAHLDVDGYAPSMRDLMDDLGIRSTNGISDHLLALEAKGLITRDRRIARSIRLTEAGLREARA